MSIPEFTLGDVTEADWAFVLDGVSYDEYVRPVVDRYRQLGPTADRNDAFRDFFNSVGGTVNERDLRGVARFYSDWGGIYCRLLAFESIKNGTLRDLMLSGRDRFTESAHATALQAVKSRFNWPSSRLVALDHGCGPCPIGLFLLSEGFRVIFHDYCTPNRRVIQLGLRSYLPEFADRASFLWVGKSFVSSEGPYHFAVSTDVLEHVPDPVAELSRIAQSMVPGGILMLGTFFNSCNGHDPSHLDEHARFQDTALWFSEVEKCGFRLYAKDANGCEKVFERV